MITQKPYQLIILCILILAGCKKEEISPLENSYYHAKTLNKVQEFQALETNTKKVAYRLLSPIEKTALWHLKLDDFRGDNKIEANQKKLLDELEEQLKPKIFVQNSESNKIVREFGKEWISRAKVHFSREQIASLVLIGSRQSKLKSGGTSTNVIAWNCNCNFEYDQATLLECGGFCEYEICDPVWPGCGFWGLEVCDAECWI